jgi:hypothetical protein
MRRHSKVHDLATGMIQDHKDVQDLKAKRRNRVERRGSDTEKKALADTTFIKFRGPQALHDSERVHCPGHWQVIS